MKFLARNGWLTCSSEKSPTGLRSNRKVNQADIPTLALLRNLGIQEPVTNVRIQLVYPLGVGHSGSNLSVSFGVASAT